MSKGIKNTIQEMIDTAPSQWVAMFKHHKLGKKPKVDQLIDKVLEKTPSGASSGQRGEAKHKVPKKVRQEAFQGLLLAHKHNWSSKSGIGLVRAMQLVLEPKIWDRSVNRMDAFFTRHARDKESAAIKSGKQTWGPENPSRGYIAHLAWGGDSGQKWASKQVKKTNPTTLNSLNPTGDKGGIMASYDHLTFRATAPLGPNMTTMDRTMGGSPDDLVRIFRGIGIGFKKDERGNQKRYYPPLKINVGDYVTIFDYAAKDYAGSWDRVASEVVRKGDLLDQKDEPSGGYEFIYRPNADKQIKKTNPRSRAKQKVSKRTLTNYPRRKNSNVIRQKALDFVDQILPNMTDAEKAEYADFLYQKTNVDRVETIVSEAQSRIPKWNGSDVRIDVKFERNSFTYDVDIWVAVYVDETYFTVMGLGSNTNTMVIDDVAEDYQDFSSSEQMLDYQNLINEIRKPYSTSSQRRITVFTAQPIGFDQQAIIPKGTFFTSRYDDALGIASERGGREVFELRIPIRSLIMTKEGPENWYQLTEDLRNDGEV